MQGLRALCFAIVATLMDGNTQNLMTIIKENIPHLLHWLRSDIILNVSELNLDPNQIKSMGLNPKGIKYAQDNQGTHRQFIGPTEELSNEGLKLFLDMINIAELRSYCDKLGVNLNFLLGLQDVWSKNKSAFNTKFAVEQDKEKLMTSQLLQAINERKGIN